MGLVIEQIFPLGRFHATRWNQNPFEDPFGEWPPSPWRLLRALAGRWFQYARETGDADEANRNALLGALAKSLPAYHLPALTWRGQPIRQYHPAGLDEKYKYNTDPKTKKKVLAYKYREVTRTLVQDHYRAVPTEQAVYWCWREEADLSADLEVLLDGLLERCIYLGRAESFCRMKRLEQLPGGTEVNCALHEKDDGTRAPVLVPIPAEPLHLDALLDSTDGRILCGRPIPPGTTWYYASLPPRPPLAPLSTLRTPRHLSLYHVQFGIGGQVMPPLAEWVKIAERMRGRALKRLCELVARDAAVGYAALSETQHQQISLFSGKDAAGKPLSGHRHPYFLIWPDSQGRPSRFIVWRREAPFTDHEIKALFRASELPISWQPQGSWALRLVPLPFETPLPVDFASPAQVWETATPFVPPAERHRYRANGRLRPGEAPGQAAVRLLAAASLPRPIAVTLGKMDGTTWVRLHESRGRRALTRATRTPFVRPGFRMRIEFDRPVTGPIMIGDSCHFGLGIFRAASE